MAKPDALPPLPTSHGSVKVQLLDGGSFTADYNVLHAGVPSTPFRCYSWAFYIHHEPSGRRILWDVGLSAVSLVHGDQSSTHAISAPSLRLFITISHFDQLLMPRNNLEPQRVHCL